MLGGLGPSLQILLQGLLLAREQGVQDHFSDHLWGAGSCLAKQMALQSQNVKRMTRAHRCSALCTSRVARGVVVYLIASHAWEEEELRRN